MAYIDIAQILGNIGEFVGAIAVVVTLAYLAIQVRQNSEQIRLNTETAKVSAYHETIDQIVVAWTDIEFAQLSARYEESPDSLSPEECTRLEVLWVPALFGHEIALELYNNGLIHPRLWENMLINNLPLLTGAMPMRLLKERTGPLSTQLYAELKKHKAA